MYNCTYTSCMYNYVYNETSNKGPSEKGTTSLSTKDTSNIHRKEDSLPTRDKMAGPNVSLT